MPYAICHEAPLDKKPALRYNNKSTGPVRRQKKGGSTYQKKEERA